MTGDHRGRPTIGPERNDLLREIVKSIRDRQFKGNSSATSRALKLESPGYLHEFLAGGKGAGMRVIEGLVAHTGRTIDQIFASGGDLDKLMTMQPIEPPVRVKFGELPNWPELLEGAKSLKPDILDRYWQKTAEYEVWVEEGPINNVLVADFAEFLSRHR